MAEQWWGPDYADGTLRWGAPIIPGLAKGGTFLIEVEHRPAGQGRSKVTWRVNGATRWEETMQLLEVLGFLLVVVPLILLLAWANEKKD